MNYIVAILEHLIDTYERRGMYNDFDGQKRQGIFLYVEKVFPEYVDTYDGNAYQNINEAIEYLRQQDILQGKKMPAATMDDYNSISRKLNVAIN